MRRTATSKVHRRSTVVLIAVLLSLLAFGATTQTWLSVQLPQTSVQTPAIDVAGSEAATAVTAFALVGLAAALAVSIAGKILRWVITAVLCIAGLGVAFSSAAIIRDPESAASAAIGKAVGVSDGSGASIALTAFPAVAAAGGILLALTGVWAAVSGRTWTTSQRYSSRAEDLPEGQGTDGQGAETDPGNVVRDDIDSWDQLSHGQDPTR